MGPQYGRIVGPTVVLCGDHDAFHDGASRAAVAGLDDRADDLLVDAADGPDAVAPVGLIERRDHERVGRDDRPDGVGQRRCQTLRIEDGVGHAREHGDRREEPRPIAQGLLLATQEPGTGQPVSHGVDEMHIVGRQRRGRRRLDVQHAK